MARLGACVVVLPPRLPSLPGRVFHSVKTMGLILLQSCNTQTVQELFFGILISMTCFLENFYIIFLYVDAVSPACQSGQFFVVEVNVTDQQPGPSNTFTQTLRARPAVCSLDQTSFGAICDQGLGSAEAEVFCRMIADQYSSVSQYPATVIGV